VTRRGLFLRRRGSPWRWPAAAFLALGVLLAGTLLTPRAWITWFLTPRDMSRLAERETPAPWLTLLPPPVVEIAPPPRPERRTEPPPPDTGPRPDADWWREGWRIRIAAAVGPSLQPTPEDSVRYLLTSLGLETDLVMRARPDSVMAVRLILLERESSFRFDELKPYFQAMTRARAYADLQSRVADMYDHFLASEIMAPDPK
jgi:hypothetical protein